MMLMMGSLMCHRREREADSQSEPASRLGHSLPDPAPSADLHGFQDIAEHPRGLLALGALLVTSQYLSTLLQPFLMFNVMKQN